jgi:hypothetical protein
MIALLEDFFFCLLIDLDVFNHTRKHAKHNKREGTKNQEQRKWISDLDQ